MLFFIFYFLFCVILIFILQVQLLVHPSKDFVVAILVSLPSTELDWAAQVSDLSI